MITSRQIKGLSRRRRYPRPYDPWEKIKRVSKVDGGVGYIVYTVETRAFEGDRIIHIWAVDYPQHLRDINRHTIVGDASFLVEWEDQ